MAGRQRSAARGVKAGLTRLRRRRWSSPSMQRMLRRSSSASGPGLDAEQLGQLASRGRSSSGCAGRPRSPRGRAPSRRWAWPPASPARAARPSADGSPGRAARGRCSRGPAGRARTAAPWRRTYRVDMVRRCGRWAYGRPWTASTSDRCASAACASGTMLMGGRTPADEAHRMLDAFVAAGAQLPRHRRRLRRRRLRARRSRPGSRAGATRSWWPPRSASRSPIPAGRASPPSASRAACDARLRRLGVDVIDLYQLHAPDPDVAARGHAGGARRPRARRQGARGRRLELPRLAAGVGRRASRTARAGRPSSRCSRSTRSSSARSRPRSCPSAAGPAWASCPWGPLGAGFLTGRYERDARAAAGLAHGRRRRRPRGGAGRRGDRAQLPRGRRGARGRRRARAPPSRRSRWPGCCTSRASPRRSSARGRRSSSTSCSARPTWPSTTTSSRGSAPTAPPERYPDRMLAEQVGLDVERTGSRPAPRACSDLQEIVQ